MPRRAKKSTGGAPRGSQYINGKLVHMATNQKLYFQTSVSTVFRETLKPQEQFSKNAAERVMERNLRKRQSRGTMNVLEDQFTLEKNKLGTRSPFRPYLYYREIEEIQRSKTKPEYFVLSVDSEKSGLKYYEVYKCKTADDAYKFEKYVRQAMEDPEDRIREGQALGVVPVENNPDMRRSLVYVDFQTSMESLEENDRRSGLYQPSRQSPTPVLQVPQKAVSPPRPASKYRSPTIVSPVQVPAPTYYSRASPRRQSPSPPRRYSPRVSQRHAHSLDGLEGTTYISFDPRTGRPRISDDGPVYMYLQRMENLSNQAAYSQPRASSVTHRPSLHNGVYANDRYSRY